MKITRNDFFEQAVHRLYENEGQAGISYLRAINKAMNDFSLDRKLLRELLNKGEIEIGNKGKLIKDAHSNAVKHGFWEDWMLDEN